MSIFATPTNLTPKVLKSFSCLLAVLVVVLGFAPSDAKAELASIKDALTEMSIGSPDAPVTLHEYSSLTCPHCANFHVGPLMDIKKNYVETGKVRVVFHDFPLDNLALAAVSLARCAGPERNVEFFDMLYSTQGNWSRADNPLGALTALSRFYGLSSDDVMTCLNNEELRTTIMNNRNRDADMYGIKSTPSFMLDGKLIEGSLSYDDFADMLDKALAAKGAN